MSSGDAHGSLRATAAATHTWGMASRTRTRDVPLLAEGSETKRRTQAERSEITTDQLLLAARELFASKGFPATSIQEIVDAAGVTRGALYHHFASKEELFEAVVNREQEALGRRVRDGAMKRKGAWAQLKAGCDEFLDASLDPDTQRILMIDGPAVLGSARIQEKDESHSIELLKIVIEKAIGEGTLRKRPVMPIVHLLFGALCQAAMVIARSADPESTTRQMRQEIHRLLNAIEAA